MGSATHGGVSVGWQLVQTCFRQARELVESTAGRGVRWLRPLANGPETERRDDILVYPLCTGTMVFTMFITRVSTRVFTRLQSWHHTLLPLIVNAFHFQLSIKWTWLQIPARSYLTWMLCANDSPKNAHFVSTVLGTHCIPRIHA